MARLCDVLVYGLHPAHRDLLPAGVFLDGDNDKPSSRLQQDIRNCLGVVSEDIIVHPIAFHEMFLCRLQEAAHKPCVSVQTQHVNSIAKGCMVGYEGHFNQWKKTRDGEC